MPSKVFVGSASGLTPYQLKHHNERLFPDVYVPKPWKTSLRDRTVGAVTWAGGGAIVAGAAASALHGSEWVDAEEPIELIWRNGRPPEGLVVRNEAIASDEITKRAGILVTAPARTALDFARHLEPGDAVARMDALKRSTAYSDDRVLELAERYRGGRGIGRVRAALSLVDRGAESPKETWLRLLLISAGLPAPTTQIVIGENRCYVRTIDMGWEDFKVGAEYDGDLHRTKRRQYAKDVLDKRTLARLGWDVTHVIEEDNPAGIVATVRRALIRRGWRP